MGKQEVLAEIERLSEKYVPDSHARWAILQNARRLTNKKECEEKWVALACLVVEKLMEFKKRAPELRLGQVIWNALGQDGRLTAPEGNALFYIHDAELLRLLEEHFKTLEAKKK